MCDLVKIPSLDALCHLIRTLAECNASGKWTQSYIYGIGLLAMNTNTTTEQLLTDGRGSITEALSATSTTTYRYDAFGNVTREGTSSNPFTYNQERFDSCANLQYLRARYVDLELSRFISRDTVLGTPEDPRTHNLYLYVQNDPLTHIDPSGNIANWQAWEHRIANCSSRCNRGLNIPSHRTSCASCGIPRPRCSTCNNGRNLSAGSPGRTCSRCNRQGRWVQPPGNPNPAAHRPPTTPLPGDPNRGIPSNRINRTQEAEDRTHFKVCIALPAPGEEAVDWQRTTITLRIPVASRVTTVRRDPIENRVEYALWAIPQLLAGGRTAREIAELWGVSIYVVQTLIDAASRDNISLQSLPWTALGLVLPGTFALEEGRTRLVDATLSYAVEVTYRFAFEGQRGTTRGIKLPNKRRTIANTRMIGLKPEITSQLTRLAYQRDRVLARNVWYREALRRR